MFRKKVAAIMKLDRKTAFLSALSMNIFFIFVGLVIVIYSYYMGENVGEMFAERLSAPGYYIESLALFFINTLILFIFFRIEFWILTHFNHNKRMVWLLFLAMIVLVGALSTAISQVVGIWIKGPLNSYQYSIIQFIKDLLLFISSVFVTYLIYLINKNQERIEENKNLTIENFKNRYNALKNQTDPHFLFNSLNSLNGLIGYDNERAHEYLMQLSSVFRYTIQERSVVSLSDELAFTRSYIYLMKIRYGDAFSVDSQIDECGSDCSVLPFSVQTLVENAIKHNIVSLQKPLKLRIMVTDRKTIIVENNLQPRQGVRHGNGLGLSNLNERYWLVCRKNINIEADETVFRVEVPLIENGDKYSSRFDI